MRSPDTKAYANYSQKVLTKKNEQDFKAFGISMQYHARCGLCTNAPRAKLAGLLIVSEALRAWERCLEL